MQAPFSPRPSHMLPQEMSVFSSLDLSNPEKPFYDETPGNAWAAAQRNVRKANRSQPVWARERLRALHGQSTTEHEMMLQFREALTDVIGTAIENGKAADPVVQSKFEQNTDQVPNGFPINYISHDEMPLLRDKPGQLRLLRKKLLDPYVTREEKIVVSKYIRGLENDLAAEAGMSRIEFQMQDQELRRKTADFGLRVDERKKSGFIKRLFGRR